MYDLSRRTNVELFSALKRLARRERKNLPRILAHLAELDKRNAMAESGTSLFSHCTRTLHWSEAETARRIQVARCADQYKQIYSLLWTGNLNLSTVALLAPHLTAANHREVLDSAKRLSFRETESLVSRLAPRREKPERVRMIAPSAPVPLDAAATEGTLFDPPGATSPREETSPLPQNPAPLRVEFTFTADEALVKDVEDARALLRNKYPFCRLEDLFREAVHSLLDRLDPGRRPAPRGRPGARKPGQRRIPPAVRAFVWKRDKGRCAYVAPDGTRCQARAFLEFDHVRPWALGGPSDDPRNLRLLCRSHNMDSARRVFGFI